MRIELKGVSKVFPDGNRALDNITYREDFNAPGHYRAFRRREVHSLKNSRRPHRAHIRGSGHQRERVCYDEKHLIQYRRKIGFVFQAKGLFTTLPPGRTSFCRW